MSGDLSEVVLGQLEGRAPALAGAAPGGRLVEEAEFSLFVDGKRGVGGVGNGPQIGGPVSAGIGRFNDVQRVRASLLIAVTDVHRGAVVGIDGDG